VAETTEGTIDIDASPSEVMSVITDYEAYPDWSDQKSAKILKTDSKGRGTEVEYEVAMMGLSAKYTLAYKYKPKDTGLTWTTIKAEGALKDLEGEYELEGDDEGTTVTFRTSVEIGVPLPGFMKRQGQKLVVKNALDGLKKRVEQG
jgi:ribosome-associated toxin RatA of RatAB toxin-antitoxin module